MSETAHVSSLSKEETVLAWSAIGVLILAIAFTVGALFMS